MSLGRALSLRLPRRFLRGNYRRVALTIAALACGVGLICALTLVNHAVLNAFVEIVDTMAGRASLQLSVGEAGLFPESLAEQVAAIPGVEQAIAVVGATAFTTDEAAESLTIQGFDLTNVEARRVYQTGSDVGSVVADALEFLNQQDSIILTKAFAAQRGLREGDHILLDTPTGRQSFTIRGLIEPEGIGKAFGGNLALMDVQAAETAFTKPGMINRVDVVVDRSADIATVAERIRRAVPSGIEVDTTAQRKADLHAVMRSLQMLLQGVALIALGAGFLIAFNRLTAIFEERTWQLGVMRAVGVSRGAVCLELVKESALLGAASVATGIPAGIALGRAILPLIAATTALNFRTIAPTSELSMSVWAVAEAAGLGMGAALLAALLPAWRVSGVSVVAVLQGRGTELPTLRTSRRVAMCATLLVSALVAALLQDRLRDPSWGLLATAFIVILSGAVAQPLLRGLQAALMPRLEPWIGPTGRLVARNLSRNPRRTTLAVVMVGIGLGTVVWLGVVALSFEATAIGVFEQAMRADFVVSSSHFGSGALEAPVDDGVLATLRQVDGVASAVGIRLANWEYRGEPIVLDAFDPDYFRTPAYGEWPLHGERLPNAWEQVAHGSAVVISSNFAQNLGARVGDHLDLDTPRGPLSLLIAGVTTDFASPRGTIEMSREIYKRYWNDGRVTRFFVEAAPGRARGAVRTALLTALAAEHRTWRIISAGDLVAYWATQIRRAFASVYVLTAVILAVILFGVADNLSAGIAERTRELGTLRAVGVGRRQLRRIVVVEALVLAGLGLTVAVAQGLAIGGLWVYTTIPYLLGWVIELRVPPGFLLFVCVATFLSCGLAAIVPGRRAANLAPAVAVRWE